MMYVTAMSMNASSEFRAGDVARIMCPGIADEKLRGALVKLIRRSDTLPNSMWRAQLLDPILFAGSSGNRHMDNAGTVLLFDQEIELVQR